MLPGIEEKICDWIMMKILVTGGAGYIGSITTSRLISQGHVVNVIDDLSTGHLANLHSQTNFFEGSILNRDILDEAISGCELVFHFAGKALVEESVRNPEIYFQTNVDGTVTLLEAMECHEVTRLVFSSSCAIYGQPLQVPISENLKPEPINPYGQSKLEAENMISDACDSFLSAISLRYFNVAGSHLSECRWLEENHSPETHLLPNILDFREKNFEIFGNNFPTRDGTSVRDYVHVEDLVEGHILAMHKLMPQRHVKINLGSGIGYSVLEVLEIATRVSGTQIPFSFREARAGDPPELIAEVTRASEILGWAPKKNLEDIVSDLWIARLLKTSMDE